MNQLRPLDVPTPSPARPRGRVVLARRRLDLVVTRTRHKHDDAYVVKDPIAMKYHRMRPDEYFVFELLDGTRTLEELRDAYQDRFQPQKVTPAELNQLIFRFHQSGLTVSDAPLQGDRLREKKAKQQRQKWIQHITGVLFIRFPGVDPEPLLRRLYPVVRPLLSPVGMAAAISLAVVAAVVCATRWETFAGEFPAMNQWISTRAVLILAAVIGGTKILHELGHAVTCKHFGGECHQIGPMLLVFTPALYCDTSDSWMLPSRYQRAAVGLAGIGTEVILASIATLVWASTGSGIVHYVSMNVMLVCSVSTVLFNANPLLRYDGYFVLSDLVDVPNLAEKSRKRLAGRTNQWLLGVDELSPEPISVIEEFWLLFYASAAFVYRWSLTLLILYVIATLLRPYGLESVGLTLCVFAAGGMLFAIARGPVSFFRNPSRRKQLRMNRVAVSSIVAAVLVLIAMVPLPSGVSADAKIVPGSETPIYVKTSGVLRELSLQPGDLIREGDVIARLTNADVELQYVTIAGRHQTQTAVVAAMRRAALDSPEIANELPSQEALLSDLQQQLTTHTARRDGLTITSPASGRLIAAPRRGDEHDANSQSRLVYWSGYPTDPRNQNCFLEPGHELASVLRDDQWDAEIILSQSDVQRIAVGAGVKLALEAMPSKRFHGSVIEIAKTKWDENQNADRRDDPNAKRLERPLATSYAVRVSLDEVDDVPLITGARATCRVEAASISLLGRAWRSLTGLFRFR